MARRSLPSRVCVSTAIATAMTTTNATTTKYMPSSLPSWKPSIDQFGRDAGRPFELGPNIQPWVYTICSRRIPNPSVASARKTPDSRMAGMAMNAPTGTATRAASRRAISQGMPAPVKCAIAAAPMAAKAYWHRETWRDVRRRRPSERMRITRMRALV